MRLDIISFFDRVIYFSVQDCAGVNWIKPEISRGLKRSKNCEERFNFLLKPRHLQNSFITFSPFLISEFTVFFHFDEKYFFLFTVFRINIKQLIPASFFNYK